METKVKNKSGMKGIEYNDRMVSGIIFGGPYRNRPASMPGYCMAEELQHLPHDVAIPTRDFSVPTPEAMVEGMKQARKDLRDRGELYVGCMGGIGRTGLFMGSMKLLDLMSAHWLPDQDMLAEQAINYVRMNYKGHAIETNEQEAFLKALPLRKMAFIIRLARLITLKF